MRPRLTRQPPPYTPALLAEAAAARDVSFDPAHVPVVTKDLHIKPQHEAPLLSGLVSDGKLPPLAERLPDDPVVLEGPDGIGNYGGTWVRLANQPSDVGDTIPYRMSGSGLVRFSPLGEPIVLHLAKSLQHSPDFKVWTVELRHGVRWSDGFPFTTDDIMYFWDSESNNKYVIGSPPAWMIVNGKSGRIEKIDQFRFTISFDDPCPLLPLRLVTRDIVDSPAHYLRPLNPDPAIGDAALCNKLMAAYKQPSRSSLYTYMKLWHNPEHPRMWPWVYHSYRSSTPQIFVRNPYYFAVDPQGNQLPYLDRLQFSVQDPRVLAVTAANGGVSMQDRHLRFGDYTELMSRRDVSGTRVLQWYPGSRSVWEINPNLNRQIDPADPASANKAALLSDKHFRQALSLALDRRQIIDAEFNGVGEPSQIEPGPQSPFHSEKLAEAFVQHDPARANAMLDELGLMKRDLEGFRTFPDGTRMVWYLDLTSYTGDGPAQFIIDDWANVGIRTVLRVRNRPYFYAEKDAMTFDFNVWTGESDFTPLIMARFYIAYNIESFFAPGWGKWYERGGMKHSPDALAPGAIEPPVGSPMRDAMTYYDQALMATTLADQQKLMARVTDIAAENLWSISIATPPPQLVVVKDGFKNIPNNALSGAIYWTPGNSGIETYFWEHPTDSAGALAETRQAIVHVTPRPGTPTGALTSVGGVGKILRISLVLIALLFVAMLCLRHPFIMRRLAIMLPTLLVISIAVFTIIQLPPGDFLTTRLSQLAESGDAKDLREIVDLRELFHFNEPAWKQYCRWMGLKWFVSFESVDTGLLQGNLGRSMETKEFVNTIVGDRIVLTVLLSLGTIIFTWVVALPIGIYSAARQYSTADYALTLIGFVGMCVPSFLLALVLMAISNQTGLFSARYAIQPEWDAGKVFDLLRHIWIPIVVLGVGGTAAMIRVMRANLLDELKRPYVTTALAKGVRPLKLLIKYPVRMALNPFISGIGALFPQLVSGGAIVSIVLALPTVGPLQITALLNQDMYLAGSMLMVLSVLSVLGTLVSDLLLLWLDPRIRYEGGGR